MQYAFSASICQCLVSPIAFVRVFTGPAAPMHSTSGNAVLVLASRPADACSYAAIMLTADSRHTAVGFSETLLHPKTRRIMCRRRRDVYGF